MYTQNCSHVMLYQSGNSIGSCTLVTPCGRGAFGEVWIVKDMAGRHLAMKILDNSTRSQTEVTGLKAYLNLPAHPNLISIFHIGEEGNLCYYTMDLADNASANETAYVPQTLTHVINTKGHLPCKQTISLGLQLLDGLECLHNYGLVHRDIKPDNIIFVGGIPKLADMGLVAEMSRSSSLTGTLGFISPERLLGKVKGKYTSSDDLYAIGKVIYCIWSGKQPEDFPSLPPDCMKTRTDARLNAILKKTCGRDVAKRFKTAAELRAELENLAQSCKNTTIEKPLASEKLKTILVTILTLLIVFGVGMRLYYHYRPQNSHPKAVPPPAVQALNPQPPPNFPTSQFYSTVYIPPIIATQQTTQKNLHENDVMPLTYNLCPSNPIPEAQRLVPKDTDYVFVDLSQGPNATSYPLHFSQTPPDVSKDDCRTTELWLRRIHAGTFYREHMGDNLRLFPPPITQTKVTLTQDYFIAIFEVTQKQWELVMGNNPSQFSGDDRPVDSISFTLVRGASYDKGAGWPVYGHRVDEDSFMGRLQRKTGLMFDLPTSAQWEFALRSTVSILEHSFSMEEQLTYGRYRENRFDGRGGYTEHTRVGSYKPNINGLYDMSGNVIEIVLDSPHQAWDSMLPSIDPTGPPTNIMATKRGGAWSMTMRNFHPDQRPYSCNLAEVHEQNGFRPVMLPAETSPKLKKEFFPEYIVIDLSNGPQAAFYPVRYSEVGPILSNNVCRTSEIWLKRMPAGSFLMGAPFNEKGFHDNEIQHLVIFPNPFYMGMFEITQHQYELVTGNNPIRKINNKSEDLGATKPISFVSFKDIREESLNFPTHDKRSWPQGGHAASPYCFLGKLQERTGILFDLPTEAEWEYACRAGTTRSIYVAPYDNFLELLRDPLADSSMNYPYTTFPVGTFPPNPWGLFDMQGNVREYCLDWYAPYSLYQVFAPTGPMLSPIHRHVCRGADFFSFAYAYRSALRHIAPPSNQSTRYIGFRLAYSCDAPPLPVPSQSGI